MPLLVSACVFTVVLTALLPVARHRGLQRIREYLYKSGLQTAATTIRPRPPWAPLVPPPAEQLIHQWRRLRPDRPDPLALRLAHAGLEHQMTPEQFIALRFLAPLGLFLIMFLPYLTNPNSFRLVMALASAGGGVYAPDQWLKQRLKSRQERVRRDLPGFLTTLAVLLDAGLNLVPALSRAAAARPGPLAELWQDVSHRIQLGTPVSEALESMAAATGVTELTLFISSLVQSLDKGAAGISEAVRSQARQVWALRQQAVQQKGQEVSQDVFLVLLLLAFPAVAIFLLGPVGISLYRFFTHQSG